MKAHKFLTALAFLFALLGPVVAQTYYEAPLTGEGAGCVPRPDLTELPANNNDQWLLLTHELINEGRPDNDQAYFPGQAVAQKYLCLTDQTYGTRCGSTQASYILSFQRKASANVKLIIETQSTRFHFLTPPYGAPIWIGAAPDGRQYVPYPIGYPNFCRVWNTNHLTRHNLSMVLMLPWPNSVAPGSLMPFLIDNVDGGRNRLWVIAE